MLKDFQNYLQQCKSKGFTLNADVEDYFGHESYQAENSYGNKLHIYYKSSSNYNSPCRIVVEIQR